jgi:predicted transcriptional regulator of viral defense system
MRFSELFKELEKSRYYIFSLEDIRSFFPGVKNSNLKKLIYRWKKSGQVYPLKRGLYELTYPGDLIIPDMYIANKLYEPSYVSLETALSHFSIIPEVSMAVTSISTKPTRRFRNRHGLFIYRTVSSGLFEGYYVEKHGDVGVRIAEPEKAIVDFIYFKTYRKKKYKFSTFIEEERLDKEIISGLEFKKMDKYAKSYKIDLKGFYAEL